VAESLNVCLLLQGIDKKSFDWYRPTEAGWRSFDISFPSYQNTSSITIPKERLINFIIHPLTYIEKLPNIKPLVYKFN